MKYFMLGLKLWYPDTLNAPFHSRLKAYIPERKRRRIKYRFQCNLQNDSSHTNIYQPMLHHGKKPVKCYCKSILRSILNFTLTCFTRYFFSCGIDFAWQRFTKRNKLVIFIGNFIATITIGMSVQFEMRVARCAVRSVYHLNWIAINTKYVELPACMKICA